MSKRFVVRRDNLRQTRWEDRPPVTLEDGSVRLRIDAFALTSNNITYAAFGEAMNYWGFYPTGDATTGCIPVWGFASVVESRCAGVDVGERFYGFWPIADEAVLSARAGERRRLLRRPQSTGASCTRCTTSTCAAAQTRPMWPSARPSRRCCARCSAPRS